MQDTFAYEVAIKLQSAGLGLVIGENLFVDHIPPEVEECVAVYTDNGMPQDMYLPTRNQYVSLWARSKRGDVATSTLEKALQTLHQLNNVQLGHYYLYNCYANTGIMYVDTDDRRRRIYKVTFSTSYYDMNVIS